MNSKFQAALLSEDNQFYQAVDAPSITEKEARLNVYRNNVFVSLIDALSDIFPVTQTLVGEDFFRAMAREYVQQSLPKSPVISEYGENFADFIAQFPPAQSLPFLANLAALEHGMLTLTNEAEQATLSQQDVAEAFSQVEDPSDLLLALPASSKIFVSPYAIGSIYKAHLNDGDTRLGEVKVDSTEHLFLVKSHLYAQLHIITKAEAIFFKNLLQGKSLAEAAPDEEDFDLGSCLAELIEWKVLTQIQKASR